VEACIGETRKLGSLLSSSSPVVSTYIAVSVFVRVDVRTPALTAESSAQLASVVNTSNSLLLKTVSLQLTVAAVVLSLCCRST